MEANDPRLLELLRNAVKAHPHLESSGLYNIAFCHLCKKRGLVFVCYRGFKVVPQCT